MRRTFISKFPNANLPLISINLEFVKWGNSDLFVGSHELLKYLRIVPSVPEKLSLEAGHFFVGRVIYRKS